LHHEWASVLKFSVAVLHRRA